MSEDERVWRENLNTGDDLDALKVETESNF